ncbi:MAG: hypothetical protein QNJ03_15925, partial [Dinoroseobacter sp.]|nr:hypothetical protein [Dinoroseobacter sp.]
MSTPLLTVGNFRTVTEENELLRVSCTVSDGNSSDTDLWFEVSGLPPASTIDTADAFLAPCLLFALKRHSSIHFNVPISDCLVQQADDIAHIFGIQLGLNTKIAIKFSHITIVERKQRGGITGFSAGVDSWFSLKKNLLDLQESSKKLTHLLVNDVGANTSAHKKEQVLRQAKKAAGKFNLGLVGVNSNMSAFLSMNFQQTHTARNASTAHLLSSICDTFYYSSTDTYTEAGVFPTYDMAYADTILLSLLSSDAIALRSTGSAFSRAEKTHEILEVPDIGENLDVCVNHRHAGPKINCGYCWKCLRTEVTLEVFDAL